MNARNGLNTQALEQRLAEAEATIQALVSGQVDAVVDARSQTPVLLAKAQEALQASLAEFRSLAEAMPQIVWITGPDGGNVYVNQQWMDYTGLSLEESVGDGWTKPFFPEDRERAWGAWQHAMATMGTYSIESRLRRSDGVYRWWLVRGVPVEDGTGTILKWFGTCTDVHDLKVAELEISRINRALKMLSSCNEALIRAKDESDLLNEVCKVVVEVGGYRMAWIGYAKEDEARSVTPMAHAGVEEGYLAEVNVTWNQNEPLGRGPVGQAILSNTAVVHDDVAGDSEFAPWLPFAQTRGYRGNICLPLRDATHTFGVLGLYSAGVNQTSAEELRLLQQMADDLAFGIGSVRADADRGRLDSQSREQAALLDIASEAIMVKDLDGRIVYWNKGAERTYGWSAAEALGRKAVSLLHSDTAQSREAEVKLLAHGKWTGEVVKHTKDGRDITVEARWTLVRDAKGRPKSILAINSDISERKQAARTLRAAEERIRFALENANVGIWDLDYATGVCRWSEILESQFGLSPGTFGQTFEAFVEIVHPDDREAMRDTVANAMKSGADFSYVHRVIWPDGTKRWLSGAGRILLGERGEPVRGVGTYQDVTERHALEAQLAQSQKLEAIGQLAGGIAHDFNNLLTVIGGRSSLLLMKMRPDDPARKEVDLIQSTAQRAAGLTRQLLAFSRRQVLEPKAVNLQALVDGVTPMLRRLIGEHIEIVIVSGHDLGQIMADPGQMEQVVVNLVVNARDAMPDGGTLTIETSNRTVQEAGLRAPNRPVSPGPYVTLSVVDTGYGMDPTTVTRIFEPFFTTKEPGKGTGLGLSTVHGIVNQSGGYLAVESAVGRGTTFTISLPRILDPVDVARVAQEPLRDLLAGSGTVLLVEDDEELRRLASEILRTSGYTVLDTGDPLEALTICDRHEGGVDLLLTDMVMPAMRGTELAARLRESRPGLKMLFMSGYADETGDPRRAGGPARLFLQKPFTPHDLTRIVREALAEERAEAALP